MCQRNACGTLPADSKFSITLIPCIQRIPFTIGVENDSVALSRGVTFLEHLLSLSPGEQPLGFLWSSGQPSTFILLLCLTVAPGFSQGGLCFAQPGGGVRPDV